MVLNPGKCHNIVIDDDDPTHKICLNNNEIASSNLENLSGILLNSKLNFDSDLDVYFSIFKQSIEQHSRKSLTFDLQ